MRCCAGDESLAVLCVLRISSTTLTSRGCFPGRLLWQPEICGPPVRNGSEIRIS